MAAMASRATSQRGSFKMMLPMPELPYLMRA
jgi:hypothetical protein